MKILFSTFLILCFLIPVDSSARKRRVAKRKWSLSLANGYSFSKAKKDIHSSIPQQQRPLLHPEGQMNDFFHSLEVSRNFGNYEIGAKIQHTGQNFISPFFTWNLSRNHSRSSIVPSITLGLVPSHLAGAWLRFSLGLSLNRYISFSPFVGLYSWYKLKNPPAMNGQDLIYSKYNIHFNSGLKINLYI